jgi:hypothetical protein
MNNMSRNHQPLSSTLDDRLTEFTDEALTGQVDKTASDIDGELLLLKETVLRLKNAYPPPSMDNARVKQMQVRFKNRLKRETQEDQHPFWKRWLPRPQVWAALGALSAVILFVILSPQFSTAGSSTSATALSPARGVILGLALILFAVLIFWAQRRK